MNSCLEGRSKCWEKCDGTFGDVWDWVTSFLDFYMCHCRRQTDGGGSAAAAAAAAEAATQALVVEARREARAPKRSLSFRTLAPTGDRGLPGEGPQAVPKRCRMPSLVFRSWFGSRLASHVPNSASKIKAKE